MGPELAWSPSRDEYGKWTTTTTFTPNSVRVNYTPSTGTGTSTIPYSVFNGTSWVPKEVSFGVHIEKFLRALQNKFPLLSLTTLTSHAQYDSGRGVWSIPEYVVTNFVYSTKSEDAIGLEGFIIGYLGGDFRDVE